MLLSCAVVPLSASTKRCTSCWMCTMKSRSASGRVSLPVLKSGASSCTMLCPPPTMTNKLCPSGEWHICPYIVSYIGPAGDSYVSPSGDSYVCPSGELYICPSGELYVCPWWVSYICQFCVLYVCPWWEWYICPSGELYVSPSDESYICSSGGLYVCANLLSIGIQRHCIVWWLLFILRLLCFCCNMEWQINSFPVNNIVCHIRQPDQEMCARAVYINTMLLVCGSCLWVCHVCLIITFWNVFHLTAISIFVAHYYVN